MWNKVVQCLQKSLPKVLIEELPILRIIPIEAHRLKLQVRGYYYYYYHFFQFGTGGNAQEGQACSKCAHLGFALFVVLPVLISHNGKPSKPVNL